MHYRSPEGMDEQRNMLHHDIMSTFRDHAFSDLLEISEELSANLGGKSEFGDTLWDIHISFPGDKFGTLAISLEADEKYPIYLELTTNSIRHRNIPHAAVDADHIGLARQALTYVKWERSGLSE